MKPRAWIAVALLPGLWAACGRSGSEASDPAATGRTAPERPEADPGRGDQATAPADETPSPAGRDPGQPQARTPRTPGDPPPPWPRP